MVPNDFYWSKIIHNGSKCSQKVPNAPKSLTMPQNAPNGPKSSQMDNNGSNGQWRFGMFQIGEHVSKWSKTVHTGP